MKINLLDVYPDVPYRISKDQNGSYGTANNYGYGKSFISKILRKIVKNSIDFPPHYFVQVAGELKSSGHHVSYTKKVNDEDYDLYIFASSIVCHETEIKNIINLVKQGQIVLVVGPFATNNPDPYVKAGAKVIKGEPEMFFHKLNKEIDFFKSLPNITDNFPTVPLDELSFPGWDIIFKEYTPKMNFIGAGPAINIYASKGCPYSCFYYCVYPLQQGRKLRLKSPKKVFDEMLYFNNTLKVNNFIFRDPVFSINREHTVEFCNIIIESKKNFNLCIETHLKNIDNELAALLRKAGVKLVYVGIESIDDDVKKNANRISETSENQISKISYLEKMGIKVKSMYIVGLPSDTKKTYQKTFKYAQKINSTYAQFNVFTPYPGTPVFNEYKNKISAKTYEEFTQCKLVFNHDNLTSDDIASMLDDSYKNYYSNPKWIFKYISFKLKFLTSSF